MQNIVDELLGNMEIDIPQLIDWRMTIADDPEEFVKQLLSRIQDYIDESAINEGYCPGCGGKLESYDEIRCVEFGSTVVCDKVSAYTYCPECGEEY